MTRDLETNLDGILRMGFGLVRCLDGEPDAGVAMIRAERDRLLEVGHQHHLPRCELYLATALASCRDPAAVVALDRALEGVLRPRVVHTDTAVLLEQTAAHLADMGMAPAADRARRAAADTWLRLGNQERARALTD